MKTMKKGGGGQNVASDERLFGKASPDLFKALLKQMPTLPLARRRKVIAKAMILPPSTVPA